ncbi:hypothetical protein NNJEOMEG_03699 [Fundidesulfovibrio magnetotacticus]|uniref:Cytoplasmic protein n=1 Tax=Fundidesulfovibrio magnetotacticus TaxID=2730080 RepID=A0A6V8M033_9BACT|nr:DsrE family protein [Fundidesulfovibrio magnetotacticus]GFK95828.1 hypothetical protein NNJEOMEG_03699 [Fundidesulfovibrio magnetotacticus]
MDKFALFAFRGEIPCFVHVMLNAIDLREKGYEVQVILEGESVKVVSELARESHPMHALFERTKSQNLLAGACRACAHQLGALEAVTREGLPILDEMHGHAGMAGWIAKGYAVITF